MLIRLIYCKRHKKGNIFGYVPDMMTKDIMVNIIDQTLQATE